MRRKQQLDPTTGRSSAGFYVLATLAGLAVRVAALLLAPRYGYLYDHDDMVRWGIQATDRGLTTLYESPPPRWKLQHWMDGQWRLGQRNLDQQCNYPPLSVYLLAASASLFKAASTDRIINTHASRFLFCGWSLVLDVLLAAGCAALAARFRPGRAARLAYLLALLAPPTWLVSCLWGQVDTWMLAPAVWMVYAMTSGRWILAGVMFGLAAALKPQAAAFVPVWFLALLITRPRWKPLGSLAIGGACLFGLALPFTLSGGFEWWRQSYERNLLAHSQGFTTLMAFNIWYLDCLLSGNIDETVRWLGVSKVVWGNVLLAVYMVAGFVLVLARHRRNLLVHLIWTVFVLVGLVMLPTRVHERFLLLVIPFLSTAAVLERRFRVAAILLTLACTAQVAWPYWMRLGPPDWAEFEKHAQADYDRRVRQLQDAERAEFGTYETFLRHNYDEYMAGRPLPVEWLTTILSLAGMSGVIVATVRPRPSLEESMPRDQPPRIQR